MRFRLALWAYRRWCQPRLIGYVWASEDDVWMINPDQMERVYIDG